MMSYHSTSKDNIVRHNISYNFAFGSNSLSFIFLKIFDSDSLQQCSLAFFCICHISRDFLKKSLRHLNLTTFLPISPDPMSRFCSSSNLASQIRIEVFKKKINQNRFRFTRVIVMTDERTDGQTDRRTDFFLHFWLIWV